MTVLVAKRIPDHGWGLFVKGTDQKAEGDKYGPWYNTRKAALERVDDVLAAIERAAQRDPDPGEGMVYRTVYGWDDNITLQNAMTQLHGLVRSFDNLVTSVMDCFDGVDTDHVPSCYWQALGDTDTTRNARQMIATYVEYLRSEDPYAPPAGAYCCDPCRQWEMDGETHTKCPECGQPWSSRTGEPGDLRCFHGDDCSGGGPDCAPRGG